jgi:hypothetical protein
MEAIKITSILPDTTFHITPFDVIKALRLEKKVMSVLLPAAGGFLQNQDLSKLDSEVDFSKIFTGLIDGLEKLSDDDYTKMITDMFTNVQVDMPGHPIMDLRVEKNINTVFTQNLLGVYQLFFEVMRVNKFSFFELLEKLAGIEMNLTNISGKQKVKMKK